MRIKLIQNIIDGIRGKSDIRVIPFIKTENHYTDLDILFKSFEIRDAIVEDKTVKVLKNVNADPGVTEETLHLLCQSFPDNRRSVKVLNLACGRKDQMGYLQTLGFDAYGTDIDIEEETDRLKFADFNLQDNLPFDKSFFDVVICQELIEHIENPWLLMRKIKYVLKVGGTLILTTPNITSLLSIKIFISNNRGYCYGFWEDNAWKHINPLPFWEIVHCARYNGFDLKQLSGNYSFYYSYTPKKPNATQDKKLDVVIQHNPILTYVFTNINDEIRLYKPESTYYNEQKRIQTENKN